MINTIDEIKGFLLRHKQYIINIMYSGHADDPDQYYFRLSIDGSRCMLKVNNETIQNNSPDHVINQINEGLMDGKWQTEHLLEL